MTALQAAVAKFGETANVHYNGSMGWGREEYDTTLGALVAQLAKAELNDDDMRLVGNRIVDEDGLVVATIT